MKYYIGIDLGGTNIAAGVVTEEKYLMAKHSVPTLAWRSFEDIVADMASLTLTAIENAGLEQKDISCVGIGVPSSIHPVTGNVVFANNLNWVDKPLISEFQKHISLPVFLGNDADCAALGEAFAGSARDYDNVLMLTLGTGVGGGLIMNKKLFSGGTKLGFEPGHICLVYNGLPCTCGQRGCFEVYASCTGLIRQTIEAIAQYPTTEMKKLCDNNFDKVSARTAFDAARLGDMAALQVVDTYTSYVAAGAASLINVLRPDVLIIGGGLSNEGDYLLKPLNKKIKAFIYASDIVAPPNAIRATLGNDAGIIGATLLGEE